MIDILSAVGLEVLADVARRKFVVAFDFDGTLAPVVDEPEEARMRDTTRGLLRVLCVLCPCAVISGRARADVAGRLGSASLAMIAGNHGAEISASAAPAVVRAKVSAWVGALRRALPPDEVQVEDKGFTLALHYRRAAGRNRIRKRLWDLAGALPDAKLVGGHAVVNVLPADAPTKADAVKTFAATFRGRPVVFIGDDDVDEDAFRSAAVTVPIRIGIHPGSGARYYLGAQEDIDVLLRELIRTQLRADGVAEDWVEALSRTGGVKP